MTCKRSSVQIGYRPLEMKETLLKLQGLQKIDNEISQLLKEKEEIPKRIEYFNGLIKEAKEELRREKENIVDLKKRYKESELDLSSCEEKIQKYSIQLYSAKTNEEYKAFLKEIETQKRLKEETEERMLQIMEDMENSEKAIKEKEMSVLEKEREMNSKIEEEKSRLGKILSDIKEREVDRETLTKTLEKNILEIYERIRKNKNGLAVVKIEKDRCGGCLNPLPTQLILEVKKSEKIHFCEYCGRILVW